MEKVLGLILLLIVADVIGYYRFRYYTQMQTKEVFVWLSVINGATIIIFNISMNFLSIGLTILLSIGLILLSTVTLYLLYNVIFKNEQKNGR